jgi:hypothetical protein
VKPEDHLEIERLGGFAGIGLPGSHIRSRALLRGSELSDKERESVDALFKTRTGVVPHPQTGADRFRYRLKLHRGDSHSEIEVGEADLLASLQERVQDELI